MNKPIRSKTLTVRVAELSFNLSKQIYDSIRECDTDVYNITKNLGFKTYNIVGRKGWDISM